MEWWSSVHPQPKLRKETLIVIALVAWMLWKHRNEVMFDGATPSTSELLRKIELEGQDWRAASLLREAGSLPIRVDEWANSE